MSKKIANDKYYTPPDLAEYVVNKTYEIIGKENITEFLEPSAGNGAFIPYLPDNTLYYDLMPEHKKIKQQDYLKLDLEYKQGRCIIGNPPFGERNNLSRQFANKSFLLGDYVSFILPISQLNNTGSINKFDLIYSEDLGKRKYSNIEVHCCLNIYKRPLIKTNKINYKKELKDIISYKELTKAKDKKKCVYIEDFDYDFCICIWGNIGKQCIPGTYSSELAIKILDKDNFNYYKDLILNADWNNIYKMTATTHLTITKVLKFVYENKK